MAFSPGMNFCIISIKIIHFPHHWSSVRGTTSDWWIPLTKGRWYGQFVFLLAEGAAEQSMPVTRDAIAPMGRQCNGFGKSNASIQKVICRKSQWCHQMEIFSALLAFRVGNSSITGEFPRQRSVLFSLMRAWTNSWVNNGDAGDLRRHRVHCDVSVMGSKAFHHYMHYNPRFVRSVQVVEINHEVLCELPYVFPLIC